MASRSSEVNFTKNYTLLYLFYDNYRGCDSIDFYARRDNKSLIGLLRMTVFRATLSTGMGFGQFTEQFYTRPEFKRVRLHLSIA